MSASTQKRSSKATYIIAAAVIGVVCGIGYFAGAILMTGDAPKRQRKIQMVTLVKPPPPPPIKEKPPEPEVRKEAPKEEIVEAEAEQSPADNNPQNNDEPPAGDDLGVDAEGTGAGDGFGLVGRKGGRTLVGSGGGGSGGRSLMQRYGWYTHILQEEIRKKINEHMSKNGGIPEGDHKALIEIVIDSQGRVVDFKIEQSSGNGHMDEALKRTLAAVKVSEAPPDGMPRSIRLKVSSKG